jgi:hypothetical protein
MRTHYADRALGHAKAEEQRNHLLGHAARVEAEIETLHVHLGYLEAKAGGWDARHRRDNDAELEANEQVQAIIPRLEEAGRR